MGGEAGERWQTTITNLNQGICYIYDTKDFSDVRFQVRGKWIKAHKLILASRSSEFARLLLDTNAPDEFIVDKESPVTETGFEILLHFIYKNVLGTSNKISIVQAYLSAKYYHQKALKDKCEEEIESWQINADECFDLLDVGSDVDMLKQKCISFLVNNGKKIISAPSFTKVSFKTLCVILQSGALKNVPILERIDRIMEWGGNRQTAPVNYEYVRQQLLNVDPPLLSKLEFEKLSLDDLTNIFEKYENLLTNEEIIKFMRYHKRKDASILPAWCVPVD